MGLLDDAIREHLDLKRRRGADPSEVERAERDALGPVRRVAEGQDDPGLESSPRAGHEPQDELADQPEHLFEATEDPEWHDPFASEPESQAPAAPQPPAPGLIFEPQEPPPPAPTPAMPPPATPAPAESPPAAEDHPPPVPDPVYEHAGEETVEYDVEDALESAPEPAEKGDDVLEETPEFLQDTPDHDRLWFEQKPPKDFDFDG
jgi:hypothetical protein